MSNTPKRVLFFGGRRYEDGDAVLRAVEAVHALLGPFVLIEGGATGADAFAKDAALHLGIEHKTFDADWSKYGRAAGPIRNQQMLDSGIDIAVGFPGDRGTEDMARRLKGAEIRIWWPEGAMASAKTIPETLSQIEAERVDPVRVQGTICFRNRMGKIMIMRICDLEAAPRQYLQILFRRDQVGEAMYNRLLRASIGDYLAVTGNAGRSRSGASQVIASTATVVEVPEGWKAVDAAMSTVDVEGV